MYLYGIVLYLYGIVLYLYDIVLIYAARLLIVNMACDTTHTSFGDVEEDFKRRERREMKRRRTRERDGKRRKEEGRDK